MKRDRKRFAFSALGLLLGLGSIATARAASDEALDEDLSVVSRDERFADLAVSREDRPADVGDEAAAPEDRPADLADAAEGAYHGAVISDARGSSRSDVWITVTRVGPNRVRVVSDYERLPIFEASLNRYLDTIQGVDAPEVFLLDLSRDPPSLHVTVDDASWAGSKN